MPKKTVSRPSIQITYKCAQAADIGWFSTLVGGSGKRLSFKCEHCDLAMVPLIEQMELSAHGKTKNTVGHQLLSARELGTTTEAPQKKAVVNK